MAFKEIKKDLFNIVQKVKEIDPGYFVLWNYKHNRYEVHHKGQVGGTLAVVVPNNCLDVRLLVYLHKTRNIEKIIAETEENNRQLEQNAANNRCSESTYKLNQIYNYAKKGKTFEKSYNFNFAWY